MPSQEPPIRLRAFVGRSFLPADEAPWYEIRKILESLRPLGFEFEDAKEAQLRPISDKVKEGIERNDIYIGILMRRLSLMEDTTKPSFIERVAGAFSDPAKPVRWATSNWIVQESGYALGRNKKVLLLVEEGVDFPASDLDADTEWVGFDRRSVAECSTRLVSMIGNLISENLPVIVETRQLAPPKESVSGEQEPQVPDDRPFLRIDALLKEKDFKKADEEFEKVFAARPSPLVKTLYLRKKAVQGQKEALQELKHLVEIEPENPDPRFELAWYYAEFEEYKQAAQLM